MIIISLSLYLFVMSIILYLHDINANNIKFGQRYAKYYEHNQHYK